MAIKLGTGDQFPSLTLNMIDGSSMTLPDDLEATYTVFLLYRGHW